MGWMMNLKKLREQAETGILLLGSPRTILKLLDLIEELRQALEACRDINVEALAKLKAMEEA